jgi:hypothetical protein
MAHPTTLEYCFSFGLNAGKQDFVEELVLPFLPFNMGCCTNNSQLTLSE